MDWIRFARKLRDLDAALGQEQISEEAAVRSAASVVGWAIHADTRNLRRSILSDIKRRRDNEASNRVKRGGDWNNNANNARSGNRNNNNPDNRNNNLGFRLTSSRPGPKSALQGARPCAKVLTTVPPPAP